MERHIYSSRKQAVKMLLICLLGIGINLMGSFLVKEFEWPLYLDSVGTILIAAMSGYLPGIIVGLVTNMIKGIFDTPEIYYSVVNVLIAVITYVFAKNGLFRKAWGVVLLILALGIVGGGHGALLNWIIDGAWTSASALGEGFFFEFLKDLFDKSISVVIVLLMILFLPARIQEMLQFAGWQQTPLSKEQLKLAKQGIKLRVSLRTKLLWLLITAGISVGVAALIISVFLYRQYTLEEHFKITQEKK